MFKSANLISGNNCDEWLIIDKRTYRQVGIVCRKREGGWDIFIRGQINGTSRITWETCYIADKYLALVGSQQKKR